MTDTPVSSLALDVRRHDRERFTTALFIPERRRESAFVLYAFNAEVARIKSLTREPLAGAIRLQWWRDVVMQDRPSREVAHHPIAQALTEQLASGRVPADLLLGLIDAKEQDLNNQPFESLAQMLAYADATAGNLSAAVLHALDACDASSLAAARGAGIAYALTGLARSIPVHLAQGWISVPLDLLKGFGIDPRTLSAKTDLTGPVRRIVEQSLSTLDIARESQADKAAVPVCLLGTLAQGHGKLLRKAGWNPFLSHLSAPHPMPLALAWRSWRGRF